MLKDQGPDLKRAKAAVPASGFPDAALLDLLQPFESTLQRFDAALAVHSKIEGAFFQHLRRDLKADRKMLGQAMGLTSAKAALDEAHEAHIAVVDAVTSIAAKLPEGLKFKARVASESGADLLPPLIQSILDDILAMKEAQQ